ncbi:universal stress protein [Mycobacterium sp. 2YAF39]|uniref:universal stress protein n=1 Tax=Mycobacterium sp. 2YAF39 TaxID=3233033 RepID=UPI003F94E308
MHDLSHSPASIVVGIDGSRTALDAALWAVDEAVSRDIPLRLVYAVHPDDPPDADVGDAARNLAAAEIAVRHAFVTVESTDKPVKIEAEILQTQPARALIDASRSAAMICLGDMGLRHSGYGQMGSTAAAVAASAHCPVAIVRASRPRPGQGWVVAEVDGSPASNHVLQRALDEARLREAPLRVLNSWPSRFTDIYDSRAVADGNRLAKARLERQLAQWKKRYPDLDIEAVVVHGNTLNYLTEYADSIQLLVVGHERASGIKNLVGPPGYASLHEAGCSVLICQPQTVL